MIHDESHDQAESWQLSLSMESSDSVLCEGQLSDHQRDIIEWKVLIKLSHNDRMRNS